MVEWDRFFYLSKCSIQKQILHLDWLQPHWWVNSVDDVPVGTETKVKKKCIFIPFWQGCGKFPKVFILSMNFRLLRARKKTPTHFIMLFFTWWHCLEMCLKSVEHLQKFSQIYKLVIFNAIGFWITFNTSNANGSFPKEWLVTAFFHCKNGHFSIWIQTFARPIKSHKHNVIGVNVFFFFIHGDYLLNLQIIEIA